MNAHAQEGIGINKFGLPPDPSVALDISSSNKGLLIPRMNSVQRLSIFNPADGLMVYDIDSSRFFFFQAASMMWVSVGGSGLILVGPTGPTGAAGTNGTNGIDGATGPTGAAGTNGTNGIDGATGPTGASGINGTNGIDGATGPTGAAGANGINGVTGATGPTGASGINGNNGTNGTTGATGLTGASGINGTNGATGATGPTGASGTNGTNGTNGAAGATGPTGADGATNAWSLTGNSGLTAGTNFIGTIDAIDLSFKTNGTEYLRLTSIGYLGIGTIAPDKKLYVNGESRFVNSTYLNNNFYYKALNTASTPYNLAGIDVGNTVNFGDLTNLGVTRFYFSTAGHLYFSSPAQTNMLFLNGANGNIGIGSIAPDKKLYVNGESRFVNSTYLNNNFYYKALNTASTPYNLAGIDVENTVNFGDLTNLGVTRFYFSTAGHLYFSSPAQTNMLFLNGANGNIGIGTIAPAHRLELSVDDAAKPTTSTWTVTSDERLKRDVHPFTDGLDLIEKIDPVWFTYNGLAGMPIDTGVGTIAQDLQKIAPYMIRPWTYYSSAEDKTGTTYLGVNYGAMDFVLINAIKEQQKTIEELKTLIENQQMQINQLIKTSETK